MLVNTQYITLTDGNFQSEVLDAQMPVLVDCWASWCSSFQPLNPMLEDVAIELAGQIKIGRLNVATSELLAAQYGIRAVPTLLLFRDGQVMERTIGSVSKLVLANKLKAELPVCHSSRSRLVCL